DDEGQADPEHRHERAESNAAEQPRHQATVLRVPAHPVPGVLIEELANDHRRDDEPGHLVRAVAEHVPARPAPAGDQVGDADRDCETHDPIEHDPPQRDPDAFHIIKPNARPQRRAGIVGVSCVRTGTSKASFSRAPSRNGHVPNRGGAERLPVRIASWARPPRWISTSPANTPHATRNTLDPSVTTAPTAHAATG